MSNGVLFEFEWGDIDFDLVNCLYRQHSTRAIHVLDPMRKRETRCLSEITSPNNVGRLAVNTQQIGPDESASVTVYKQVPVYIHARMPKPTSARQRQ